LAPTYRPRMARPAVVLRQGFVPPLGEKFSIQRVEDGVTFGGSAVARLAARIKPSM